MKEHASPCADDFPSLGRSRPGWALFVVSVLSLFLELMLIRWISTEIRIFAYLQNTVLVVCFLGLGMGCFTCRKPVRIRQFLIPHLILVACLVIVPVRDSLREINSMLARFQDLVIWLQGPTGQTVRNLAVMTAGVLLTLLLMMLVWSIFVPLGRLMGRLIDDHPRTIKAYSINVAGSLIGIWGFVLLSVWYQPPVIWLIVVALLSLPFLGRIGQRGANLAMLLAAVGLSWFAVYERDAEAVLWSPYQKLVLERAEARNATDEGQRDDYVVRVNNINYQALIDLERRPAPDSPAHPMYGYSQYDLPARLHPNPRKMLIVGAGAGNDAAGALSQGVEQVTAVEIDPAIIALGRRYHPQRPYSSPRVRVVLDDARSYFATCDEKYDVISFGLLDSHTLSSAMTSQRLEHFVYTRESLEHAKNLLADGGVLTLTFEPPRPYVGDRLAGMLHEVFGHEPIYFRIPATEMGWGGVLFATGSEATFRAGIEGDRHLASLIDGWRRDYPVDISGNVSLTSDDWPYLYLKDRSIPVLYYLLAGMMLVMLLVCQKLLRVRILTLDWPRSHWHFFFLGAAFLLLEVQNITKASAVLGNTWWVNAVIISGVLVMILLANAAASRYPGIPLTCVYVLLCGSCLVLYFVNISSFAFLPYAAKAVVIGSLTTLPMLFSGIAFIRSFASVEAKASALGANLLGALVGGLFQTVTFLTGIKSLLLIVCGMYVLAFVTRPRGVLASVREGLFPLAGEWGGRRRDIGTATTA